MEEIPKDPLASLQLIDAMINKARNRFSENGHLYLLWGWVVLFCSIAHQVLQYVWPHPQYYLVWMLTWLAVIYQFVYLARSGKTQAVYTYTDEILKYVWLVFIIVTGLTVVIVSHNTANPNASTPVFLVMYGMPTALSGIILKQRSLVVGACCCWVFALSTMFLSPLFHMPLLSLAVIVAWIIPGYLLKAHYRKTIHSKQQ
jgi:hypothetical protein